MTRNIGQRELPISIFPEEKNYIQIVPVKTDSQIPTSHISFEKVGMEVSDV